MENTQFRRPFDPAALDLESSFRLTKYSDLKGCGCKVPQAVLGKLLGDIFTETVFESQQNQDANQGYQQLFNIGQGQPPRVQRIGAAGLTDCSVISLKQEGLCMLQSADYLYPLIDDPYMMVRNLSLVLRTCCLGLIGYRL